METRRSTAWFATKRYGYGAGMPISWQGWVATVLFIAAMAASAGLLEGAPRVIAVVLLITGFVLLCRAKTDGEWRWRWGERR